jgi:hypothetical protein
VSLEGQPPWRTGNPQGYRLIEETYGGFAITAQIIDGAGRHAPRVVLAEWVRRHAGGRDAEPDDFYWEAMSGIKAIGLTLGQLDVLNKLVAERA